MPGTMLVQNHVVNQQRLTHGKRDYCTLHAWKGRPAYLSCSFNALCHVVSSMSCMYHTPCIKHVSINTFHVYIEIFLVDKFLCISWVSLHSWNQNYMLHTTVCNQTAANRKQPNCQTFVQQAFTKTCSVHIQNTRSQTHFFFISHHTTMSCMYHTCPCMYHTCHACITHMSMHETCFN